MPVNKPMMKAMKKEYGAKKWEQVYYAVEMKKKMEKKEWMKHEWMESMKKEKMEWIKPKMKWIKRKK